MKSWMILLVLPLFLLVGCQQENLEEGLESEVAESSEVDKSEVETKNSEGTSEQENDTEDEHFNPPGNPNSEPRDEERNEALTSLDKKEYLAMLDEIEESFSNLHEQLENGSQLEMNQAMAEMYTKWDDALNRIYGVLREHLSTEEMNSLRIKQRQWLAIRDERATEESSEFEGGTLESFVYVSTLKTLTKERCYKLVEQYMK